MQNVERSITISASAEAIWKALFENNNYRSWASALGSNAYYSGYWYSGEQVTQYRPIANNVQGVYGYVNYEKKPYELTLKYEGVIKNGNPDSSSEEARAYYGGKEAYKITESGENSHTLTISMEVPSGEQYSMSDKLGNALQTIKRIAEYL